MLHHSCSLLLGLVSTSTSTTGTVRRVLLAAAIHLTNGVLHRVQFNLTEDGRWKVNVATIGQSNQVNEDIADFLAQMLFVLI